MLSVSVIVATYKDIEALNTILDSLYNQSFNGTYEVIVAEDGEAQEVKDFISRLSYPNLKHTTQEDLGWRKNKSLNNAIKASEADFLIFIDGDCIPSHFFIENYLKRAKQGEVLCGRRVELGPKMSSELREKQYPIKTLEKSYIHNLSKLSKDGARHFEEGIILHDLLCQLKYRNNKPSIIGCNFGAFKKDLEIINGFDESYPRASVGEDTDIEWRMSESGIKMSTIRNRAPVFHLYHANTYSKEDNVLSTEIFTKRKQENNLVCKDGLKKLL